MGTKILLTKEVNISTLNFRHTILKRPCYMNGCVVAFVECKLLYHPDLPYLLLTLYYYSIQCFCKRIVKTSMHLKTYKLILDYAAKHGLAKYVLHGNRIFILSPKVTFCHSNSNLQTGGVSGISLLTAKELVTWICVVMKK